MKYDSILDIRVKQNKPSYIIAREMYLHSNTYVFDEYDCFEIINEVSNFFKIPFRDIHIAGSSKMGKSYYKKKDFVPGYSDLDIAIINSNLFISYTEEINKITRGFQDLTQFEDDNYTMYRDYILKGIIRGAYLPNSSIRTKWDTFFNKLSSKHFAYFKDINCSIYMSEYYFERKQSSIKYHYTEYKSIKGD